MKDADAAPGLALVRLYSRLLPHSHRDAWVAEWQGELAHAFHRWTRSGEPHWLARARLVARALFSFRDALWIRRHRGAGGLMKDSLQDIRLAARLIGRRPAFATLFALTIAIGTGSAIAIFSVVDAVALRPAPYPEAERIAFVRGVSRATGRPVAALPVDFAERWAAQDRFFERAEAQFSRTVTLADGNEPRHVAVAMATPGLLAMLGARPQLGRLFVPDDAQPDATPALILSDQQWRKQFSAQRDIVNRTVLVDDVAHVVVGVLAPGYVDPVERAALWKAWRGPTDRELPTAARVALLVRIRPDLTRESLTRDANALAMAWNREQPRPRDALWNVSLRYLDEPIVSPAARRAVWVLAGASLGLLLIVCANATNLLLLGGSARAAELGIRRALGASRTRLVRQLMTETTLLTGAGAGAGLLIAYAGVGLLRQNLPAYLSIFLQGPIGVDARVVVFAVVLTLAVVLVAGTSPALAMSAVEVPRPGAPRTATAARAQTATRRAIVAGQIAVSVMLISGAALLVTTLFRLTNVDVGMDARRILTVDLYLPSERHPSPSARDEFFASVADRVRLIAGVQGVTIASAMPPGAGFHYSPRLQAEGAEPIGVQPPMLPFLVVDSAFFSTLGIPILHGRALTSADRAGAPEVAVIDERLAAELWPGAPAIGNRFRVSEDGRWHTVVGVAREIRARGPDDRDGPFEIYTSSLQEPSGSNYRVLAIRTTGDPGQLVGQVREAIRALDRQQPIEYIATLEERYAEELDQPRFFARIITLFGATALLLAAVGTFGVLAFAVSRRTREIGIRMALGARSGDVLRGVMREGMILAVIGVGVGLVGAAAAGRALDSMLFGVPAHDPLTLASAAVIVLLTSMLAVLAPARRASRVAPTIAMSAE